MMPNVRQPLIYLVYLAVFLVACTSVPTSSPWQQASQQLIGHDAGAAIALFGPPNHGSPPAVNGSTLQWDAAPLAINKQGQLINASLTRQRHRQTHCQLSVHTDGHFIIRHISAQSCHRDGAQAD